MSDHDPSSTERLDLADATLREWQATVLASDSETRVVDTRRGDDLYLIPAEGDPLPPVGTAVRGAIEDARRSSLMRTHSGLHLLAGVIFRDFGALVTGGNMEPGKSTIIVTSNTPPAGRFWEQTRQFASRT